MNENKIKKIFDKIILGIFTLLCLYAFFLLVDNLPIALNFLFNTNIFNKGISFFFCIFILGYILNYFENKKRGRN